MKTIKNAQSKEHTWKFCTCNNW